MTDSAKESNHKSQKFIAAYESMLRRVKSSLHDLTEKHKPMLQEHILKAKQKAVQLGELSECESEKIATYLQRDIEDAAQFMAAANQRFQDWLALDWQTIESKLFDMCRQVADKSVVEWQHLRQRLPIKSLNYYTGEITGIGSLKCQNCGHKVCFSKTSRIPPCAKCHKTEFQRII